MAILGYLGLGTLVACWVPQTLETLKEKDCKVNMYFLILYLAGSILLMLYAFYLKDVVFTVLNSMTAVGAVINIYYKVKARRVTV